MDATSEIESQGRESKMDADAATIPSELTEQFFEELQAKCLSVSLQSLARWNVGETISFVYFLDHEKPADRSE